MSTPQPPTRDPVGHSRALVEGAAILTPLGVIISWAVTLLPMTVPQGVQTAIAALVVALGTIAFSEWRNGRYAKQLLQGTATGGLVLLVLCLGCVTWDGPGFKMLAAQEIPALQLADQGAPLDAARCDALRMAAVTLRNEEGDSTSLNAPFLAGQHIARVAGRYDSMASICYEMVDRDRLRGVDPDIRARLRADWLRAWRSGRALQGGPE